MSFFSHHDYPMTIPLNPMSFPPTFPTALAQEVAERPGEWSPEQKQQVEEKLASLGTGKNHGTA